MRLSICAVGRLRRGAHEDLVHHYAKLIKSRAPQAGFTEFRYIDVDDRKSPAGEAGRAWQAQKLLQQVPDGGLIVALDEGGKSLPSESFAKTLGTWRDQGPKSLSFLIGGPYGHGNDVLDRAGFKWALGPATWPHELVPIMVAEQLYRSLCILTGHPYHHGARPKINK